MLVWGDGEAQHSQAADVQQQRFLEELSRRSVTLPNAAWYCWAYTVVALKFELLSRCNVVKRF